jgi:flagellar biogenesis protein FliO
MTILIAADAVPAGIGSVSSEILEYVKLVATLLAVVAFAVFVLRAWASKLTGGSTARNGPLQVIWRLNLEPRKTLYIVRAGTDYLLLAASDAGVELLTQLDAAEIRAIMPERSGRPAAGPGFSALLRSLRRPQLHGSRE